MPILVYQGVYVEPTVHTEMVAVSPTTASPQNPEAAVDPFSGPDVPFDPNEADETTASPDPVVGSGQSAEEAPYGQDNPDGTDPVDWFRIIPGASDLESSGIPVAAVLDSYERTQDFFVRLGFQEVAAPNREVDDTLNLTDHLMEFTYTDKLQDGGKGAEIEVTFHNPPPFKLADDPRLWTGSQMAAEWGYRPVPSLGIAGGEEHPLDGFSVPYDTRAIVEAIQPIYSNRGHKLKIRAYDLGSSIFDNARRGAYPQNLSSTDRRAIPVIEIARSIVEDHNLNFYTLPDELLGKARFFSLSGGDGTAVFAGETDWEILESLAAAMPATEIGSRWVVKKRGLSVYFRPIDAVIRPVFVLKVTGDDNGIVMDFRPDYTTRARVRRSEVVGFDPATGQSFARQRDITKMIVDNSGTQTGEEIDVNAADPDRRTLDETQTAHNLEEGESQQDNDDTSQDQKNVEATMTTIGMPMLMAGEYIGVLGVGKAFSTLYLITEAKHVINDGGYTTELKLATDALAVAPVVHGLEFNSYTPTQRPRKRLAAGKAAKPSPNLPSKFASGDGKKKILSLAEPHL